MRGRLVAGWIAGALLVATATWAQEEKYQRQLTWGGASALPALTTCPSPPCESSSVRALASRKTMRVEIDGTATVDVMCRPTYPTATAFTFLTLTASDAFVFQTACHDLWCKVTAYTSGDIRCYVASPESGF